MGHAIPRSMIKINCPVCLVLFTPNYPGRRCCSDTCARIRTGSFEVRFWRKVEKSSGCWEWTGTLEKNGYGRVRTSNPRRQVFVHRASWELAHGPIPEGLFVLHKCDNPKCVNPVHLFLGTQQDNIDDMRQKGRAINVRGERHGRAKITEVQAREILARYAAGGITQQALADEYRLHPIYLNKIITGKSWTHLQG